ncbi:hypothetical protein DIS24_g10420 [Lasiodiplodia hormozganensis]|uniref:Uncharacterized protein n=1 Tax=Lasiodiplodia hormozganensis TaxID=869390 RepID=A0AA39XPI2_9PEZI|nr:hypothetical protein DIS24_g10420 [Lasiodiplodia hormozganensis]
MKLRQSFPRIYLCIFLVFAVVLPFTAADGETKIFINGPYITGYSQLTSCAVEPLSTIVRGMSSGCGDDGSLTSYTCFCTGSSSKMNSIISSVVSTECKSHSNVTSFVTAQVSSAIAVFDSYCALGVNATTTCQ